MDSDKSTYWRGTGTLTPQARISRALSAWPGSVAQVATESGISSARLRAMASGPTSAGYKQPTGPDASKVEASVEALLRRCLQALD